MREWWSGSGCWQCQVQFVGDDDCCWLGCRKTPVYLTSWEPQPLSPLVVTQCNFRHTCARILTHVSSSKLEHNLLKNMKNLVFTPIIREVYHHLNSFCRLWVQLKNVDYKVVQLSHSSRPSLELTHPSVIMAEVCSSCFCTRLIGIRTPHSTLWPCWRKTMIHNFSPHWTWAMAD